MRGTLRGVRARVDRLAGQLGSGAGCPVCHDDEARVRFWHRMGDDPPFGQGDRLAPSQTCIACSRSYARRHLVIRHEQLSADARHKDEERRC